jgi:hypothetical protein
VTIHSKHTAAGQRGSVRDTRPIVLRATVSASLRPAILRRPCAWHVTWKLRLEGIPERVQRAKCVCANEDVTFTRLEQGRHHDGVRFANGGEVTLQELGAGVKGYLYDTLLSGVWMPETAEAV